MPGGFRACCGLSSLPPYVDVARPARPLVTDGTEPAPPATDTAVIRGSRKESVGVMTCRLIVDLAAGRAPTRPVRPPGQGRAWRWRTRCEPGPRPGSRAWASPAGT